MLRGRHEQVLQQPLRCYWPQEFLSPRKFDLEAENKPYVKWLRGTFDNGDGVNDESEEEVCM